MLYKRMEGNPLMTQLIFDIGSNATKASWVNAQGEIVKNWRVSTKLGKHLLSDGSMDLEIVQKNISAVLEIIQEVSGQVHSRIYHHCIGTEALRKATNQDLILQMFASAGLELDILTPDEEAKYERLGIMHSKAVAMLPKQSFLLIDSGGSSTECSIILSDGTVPYAHSFSFGQHKILDMLQNDTEDVLSEMMTALENVTTSYSLAYIIAAGSSVITYAMETLHIQNPGDVEGKRIMPNVPVEQPASQAGQLLVNRLTNAIHLPVYVSTYGIRHGWIFSKNTQGK